MGKLKKEIKYISLSNVVPETWKEDAVDPHSNLTAQMQAWTFFSKLKIYRKHQIAMKATSTRLEVLQIFLLQVLKKPAVSTSPNPQPASFASFIDFRRQGPLTAC